MRTSRLQQGGHVGDSETRELEARSFEFAAAVIRLVQHFPADTPRPLGEQIVAMAAGLGTDIAEAGATHSKRTHLNRLESARRLSREVSYWMRLVVAAELVSPDTMRPFLDEAHALFQALTQLCARLHQEGDAD